MGMNGNEEGEKKVGEEGRKKKRGKKDRGRSYDVFIDKIQFKLQYKEKLNLKFECKI